MEDIACKKLVRKYYSERARDYDEQKIRTWKSEKGFEAEVINEVTGALAGMENKFILEVGVGSGRIGFPLLQKITHWFVGLDLSKEMLGFAKVKMSSFKRNIDLILGDAEHLPFATGVFDAIVCISTMHYFALPERSLTEFSKVSKEKGILVYGDLTMHELDSHSFLDTLEQALSKAHAKYCKRSEMEKLLEDHEFHVSNVKVFPYRKSFVALMEDKGRYFDVKFEALKKRIKRFSMYDKKLYSIDNNGLTLFYTLIIASRENKH